MIQPKALRYLRATERLILYMCAYEWVTVYLAQEERMLHLVLPACPLKSYQKLKRHHL